MAEQQTETQEGPSPQQIACMQRAIRENYLPAELFEADEFLKPVDLFEIMLQFGEYSRNDIIDAIQTLGFKMKNIDGEIYIPVKYPTAWQPTPAE